MSTNGTKRPAPSKRKVSKKGSSKDPNAPKLPNVQSKTYFEILSKRAVKSTKFPCHDTLTTLGIRDGVIALFQNIGWGNFLNLREQTFQVPTYEFLATLTRNIDE
ncbi:hypothetical protein LXL04_006891 [Taraxacum kok-saghyz]